MQHIRDNWLRLAELAMLFGALPVALVYTEDLFPLIPTLLVIGGVVLIILRLSGWHYRALLRVGSKRAWRQMFLLYVVVAAVFSSGMLVFQPESFLAFPKARPDTWLTVMLLYPFVSALPQELLYREYFFFRYRSLLDGNKWALILLSGLLFMWGHLLFMNAFALSVTLAGGLLFAWRYYHTRSLLLAAVEHGLYGNMLFTLGFGQYIFSGAV